MSKQSWVVHWLDRKEEVHEEFPRQELAQQRIRKLGVKVIKVYRREVWTDKVCEDGD